MSIIKSITNRLFGGTKTNPMDKEKEENEAYKQREKVAKGETANSHLGNIHSEATLETLKEEGEGKTEAKVEEPVNNHLASIHKTEPVDGSVKKEANAQNEHLGGIHTEKKDEEAKG